MLSTSGLRIKIKSEGPYVVFEVDVSGAAESRRIELTPVL